MAQQPNPRRSTFNARQTTAAANADSGVRPVSDQGFNLRVSVPYMFTDSPVGTGKRVGRMVAQGRPVGTPPGRFTAWWGRPPGTASHFQSWPFERVGGIWKKQKMR